jgi:hypothetical protein
MTRLSKRSSLKAKRAITALLFAESTDWKKSAYKPYNVVGSSLDSMEYELLDNWDSKRPC